MWLAESRKVEKSKSEDDIREVKVEKSGPRSEKSESQSGPRSEKSESRKLLDLLTS